jgi:hypothetical protein
MIGNMMPNTGIITSPSIKILFKVASMTQGKPGRLQGDQNFLYEYLGLGVKTALSGQTPTRAAFLVLHLILITICNLAIKTCVQEP